MKQFGLIRQLMVLGFILNSLMLRAQLADFNLQVTTVTESCTANGRLNFQVTNTTADATVLYTIYRLPNTTVPIAVTDENTLTGLVSANYRVVATQSLGDLSNTQQQDVFITNTIVNLLYSLDEDSEICGNDGRITVAVTQSAAVSYEIFGGPVIRPLQSSNVFENLPGGFYNVRVFDACGEGVARTITVRSTPADLVLSFSGTTYPNCNELRIQTRLFSTMGHIMAFPLTVAVTATSPTGAPMNFSDVINSGTFFYFNVPLNYTAYTINVTDRCGNHYTMSSPISLPLPIDLNLATPSIGCNSKKLNVIPVNYVPPFTVSFLSAPAGFNPLTYNASHPGPFSFIQSYYNPSVALPSGNYTVKVTDACGRSVTKSVLIDNPPPASVIPRFYPGCDEDTGSLTLTSSAGLVSGQLISAPAGYPFALPQDLSSYFNGGTIIMGNLVQGNYIFRTVDGCNGVVDTNANVPGLIIGPFTAEVTENCDSFSLSIHQQLNTVYVKYYLQKLNAVTNQWGHPITGFAGVPNVFNQQNSFTVSLINPTTVNAIGQFRIMRVVQILLDGDPVGQTCVSQVHTFQANFGPRITSVYSFACQNSLYDAIVVAQGYAPLKYRITTKNGQPFYVDNNFSSIFLGLEPTVYNFQIEDACGNILNSLFDISNPSLFPVAATPFCEGQSGSLSVPGYSFLHYQWRKGNDPAIIATTNTLNFPAFNAAANNGTYFVRVYYDGNPNSCVDFTVSHQINVSTTAPNAGTGSNMAYCGSQGVVDLFSLLSGNYDPDGTWQETSNSGLLVQNLWDSTTIVDGNFQFQYTVNGSCGQSDQSNVVIVIHPQPETPVASLEQVVCDSQTIQLTASNLSLGEYLWTGPNGFTSSEQNPIINKVSAENQGIYTLSAFTQNCQSGQTNVEVIVNALPQFTIEKGCFGGQYTLSVNAENQSFDVNTASYSWTGPEGYTSSENPVTITGFPAGTYGVTVTNSAGCATEASIVVLGTQCRFPNVITPNEDTVNDVFDLSGLLVNKLEVYNRWGRLVFSQDNYTNQWHGQNNDGGQLPDSTYYYIAYLASGEEKQGWVFVTGNN